MKNNLKMKKKKIIKCSFRVKSLYQMSFDFQCIRKEKKIDENKELREDNKREKKKNQVVLRGRM